MLPPLATQILTTVGTAVVLKVTCDFTSFLHFHLLSSPTYNRFLHGKSPYALVTGASDGIGKAIAKELYSKGFNIIIHGRNAEKLKKVQEEIQSVSSTKRDVRIWVADAGALEVDFVHALEEWKDIEITLVIHNVGGAQVTNVSIDEIPTDTLLGDIRMNATFPYLLTRSLLPKLRKTSQSGPGRLVFVGSIASDVPAPGLNPYCPAKAFVRHMSKTIGAEEQALHKESDVSTMVVQVAEVSSGSHRPAVTLFVPNAETYAKSVVGKVGSQRSVVVPYVWHAMQFWLMGLLPERLVAKSAADAVAAEYKRMAKQV
ncbi:NAD-P-binding protein [Irpex rosettiformis]|uniref:NAD-P-binding protein n=1 Tax=Irpex rosettiformis TaxID=378272 RepID=A0ACB8U235_9APHY|nr:NAD-P-binding protein [Irpex rosettiformis]